MVTGAVAPSGSEKTSADSNQLGVQRDLGSAHPGNRAIPLRVLRQTSKRVRIQVRYTRAQRQGGATDTEALLVLFKGDVCLRIELRRGVPRSLQSKGQGHREAARVRGGE